MGVRDPLDELKTHQRGARVVLRSKAPDGVTQELYGLFCVHYAIRWLMHAVALDVELTPIGSASSEPSGWPAAPRHPTRAFPPQMLEASFAQATDEILSGVLPQRPLRANPRVVKRKMSNYRVKRPEHRFWPQPTRSGEDAVVILGA